MGIYFGIGKPGIESRFVVKKILHCFGF